MAGIYSYNKIAKNTVMLYIRMIVMMVITFYTTRVLLSYLGVEDFGIFNVLMGVITMFSFVSTSMTVATQRFISYEIGRNNFEMVKQVFSASIYIYIIAIIISIVLFETIGLWYVINYINVPDGRQSAALIVYQLTIIQFIFMTIRIPYNSAVIAYEKMSFYAYMSIVEAVLSLTLIYLLIVFNGDKLIIYSILLATSKVIIHYVYVAYCRKATAECRLMPYRDIDKSTFKEIFSFSGWNIFGSLAVTANNQGINLIINYFAGVIVNASVGISTQLTMGLYNLVGNLQTAFNPQLIKLYAAQEYDSFRVLLFRNSRYCFYLFLLILIPLYTTIDYALFLWLGKECVYAVEFCRCMLVFLAIESLAYPLTVAIQANGKIQLYQKVSGILFLSLVPISWGLCKIGLSPISIFVARIFQNIAIIILRYLYIQRVLHFDISNFFKQVILPCSFVTIISFPIPLAVYNIGGTSLISFIGTICVSILIVSITVYRFGLSSNERDSIKNIIISKLK